MASLTIRVAAWLKSSRTLSSSSVLDGAPSFRVGRPDAALYRPWFAFLPCDYQTCGLLTGTSPELIAINPASERNGTLHRGLPVPPRPQEKLVTVIVFVSTTPLQISPSSSRSGMAGAGATRQTAITMPRFVRGIFSAKRGNYRRPDAERVSRKATLGWFWRCFRVVTHYCHANHYKKRRISVAGQYCSRKLSRA